MEKGVIWKILVTFGYFLLHSQNARSFHFPQGSHQLRRASSSRRPAHSCRDWFIERGLEEHEFSILAKNFPEVQSYNFEDNMKPLVEWLCSRGFADGDEVGIGELFLMFPPIFELSIEKDMEPVVTWLSNRGFTDNDINSMIAREPSLLATDVVASMKPCAEWLSKFELLQLPGNIINQMLFQEPMLLCWTPSDQMQPAWDWITGERGLPTELAGYLVAGFPKLLGIPVPNMQAVARYLYEHIGLTDNEINGVIEEEPWLLGLSVEEHLYPALDWYARERGIPDETLSFMFRDFPACLGFHREYQLQPVATWLEETLEQNFPDLLHPWGRKIAMEEGWSKEEEMRVCVNQVLADCPGFFTLPPPALAEGWAAARRALGEGVPGTEVARLLLRDPSEFFRLFFLPEEEEDEAVGGGGWGGLVSREGLAARAAAMEAEAEELRAELLARDVLRRVGADEGWDG